MSELETLYARWLDGDLSAEEIKSLKASGDWDELEALVKATSDISVTAYDKEAAFKKLGKVNESKSNKEQAEVHRIKMSTILSAAASLLLLLGAIFFLKETAPVATADNGETLAYTLTDQSQILLNDGSSIAYDTENWEKNRTVTLQGEALFDVKKGSKFLVESKHGVVEVLGTSFNVRAWDDHFSVACFHGKVSVHANGDSIILTPKKAVQLKNGYLGEVEDITHEKPHWTGGTSKFKNEKIDNVFSELERQYDITVDRPVITKFFTGTFTHENLEVALEQITKPLGLKFNTNTDTKHVIITN